MSDTMLRVAAETSNAAPQIGVNPLYVLIFILMIAAIFLIAEYNRFVQLKHKIKQTVKRERNVQNTNNTNER